MSVTNLQIAKTGLPIISGGRSERLYYLDWLRVFAVLAVFLFHAVHPFDIANWHIKNDEQSLVVTAFLAFLLPWGMPFFFFLAGAGSWFSLSRRTAHQYAGERFRRLFVPLIIGSILLMPVQLFFEWRHKLLTGDIEGSFLAFLSNRGRPGFSPEFFGWLGHHLWFLGFLFAFSLVALPLFVWLKKGAGQRFIAWLTTACSRRGRLFLFLIPLLMIQLTVRPLFPQEHDWADFFFYLAFFIIGYLLFADRRLVQAVRREMAPMLIVAIITSVAVLMMLALGDPLTWMVSPGMPQFYLLWAAVSVNAWCWTLFVISAGMRHLNFSNTWLRYGQKVNMPFFVLHQPAIIFVAFFVVQWDWSLPAKLLVVVAGSFLLSIGIVALITRRQKEDRRPMSARVQTGLRPAFPNNQSN